MTSEQKRLFWQGHIDAWGKSQQTQKIYCQERNLSLAQFGYWRTQLNRQAPTSRKLVPVHVPNPSAGITLYLPAGVRLELPLSAVADVLPMVYRTIKDAS